jgi:hypothetical protein
MSDQFDPNREAVFVEGEVTLLRRPNMSEILTLEEMKARFPNEWVLINKPQSTGDRLDDLAGEVVFHSLNRDEVDQKVSELLPPPRYFTIRFLGPRPKTIWLTYL